VERLVAAHHTCLPEPTAPATGDPAGLSFLIPATLGPVDLGKIAVGARLALRSNGGLDVTSDPLPRFQGGVDASHNGVYFR